jgi:hypothetical protein
MLKTNSRSCQFGTARVLYALATAALCTAITSGCSQQYLNDWLYNDPQPARFGCATPPAPIQLAVIVGDVVAGPSLPTVAGNFSPDPGPSAVPYSVETPPLTIIEADLARLVTMPVGISDAPARLDATLMNAYSWPHPHVLKHGTMDALIKLHLRITDERTGRLLWSQDIRADASTKPKYYLSTAVEETLNLAYCRALEDTLGASATRAAIQEGAAN